MRFIANATGNWYHVPAYARPMDTGNIIHRTLIIRFSSIGDIILSSLLLRVFHKRFPDTRIDYLVKSEYADLVRFNPHVTGVIEFPARGGMRKLSEIRRAIRKSNYDLIIDIHDSIRSRYVSAGLRNVVRIHKRKLARFLLVKTKWNLYDWFGGSPSVAERYLEPVKHLGVRNDGNGLEMSIPAEGSSRVSQTVQDSGIATGSFTIGVCPSAKHKNKMWPAERFAEAAASLGSGNNAAIFLFGSGTEEKIRCAEIKARIEQITRRIPVLDFSGGMSLTETAAFMDHCSVVITNDSGLMHLAAARKRKVVAIFGPTVQQLGFFPYGTRSIVVEDRSLTCRPCTHIGLEYCPKGHFKCMNNIDSLKVIEAAKQLLNEAPEA